MCPMSPRLLRPRATGLADPRTIAGLSAWWDFSDSSQITLNSGNISQILDKSGSGRTASQSTAARQPALTSNAQNNRSMATFSSTGSGDGRFLTYGSDIFTFSGAATVFVVCKDVTVQGGNGPNSDYAAFLNEYRSTRTSVWLGPTLFDSSVSRGFRPGIDSWAGQIFDTASNYGSPTQTTNPAILQFSWTEWSTVHNNGNTIIGVNNDSVSLTSRGSSPLTFSTAASERQIGAALGGGPLNQSSVLDGRIGEILVWAVRLNDAQRLAVRRFLSRKWGVTVT